MELILEAFDYLQLPFALKQGKIFEPSNPSTTKVQDVFRLSGLWKSLINRRFNSFSCCLLSMLYTHSLKYHFQYNPPAFAKVVSGWDEWIYLISLLGSLISFSFIYAQNFLIFWYMRIVHCTCITKYVPEFPVHLLLFRIWVMILIHRCSSSQISKFVFANKMKIPGETLKEKNPV